MERKTVIFNRYPTCSTLTTFLNMTITHLQNLVISSTLCLFLIGCSNAEKETNQNENLVLDSQPKKGSNQNELVPVINKDSLNNAAQQATKQTELAIENRIQFIRGKYKIIEKAMNDSLYRIEYMEVECGLGTGSITKAYEGDELRYISTSDQEEMGWLGTSYYFWDDELFFVFDAKRLWKYDPAEWTIDQSRIYFQDQQPIRCLGKYVKSTIGPDDVDQLIAKEKNTEFDCDYAYGTIMSEVNTVTQLEQKDLYDYFCDY